MGSRPDGDGFEPLGPAGRASVVDVVRLIRAHQARAAPLSVLRLGDGEGRVMGFPELVSRTELDRSLQIWFGRTDFPDSLLTALARELRAAVKEADVIGIPRLAQQERPVYRVLVEGLRHFGLMTGQMVVDSALHRYLQFGLFFREFMQGLPFCGLVTARDLARRVQEIFSIGRVEQHLVGGESRYRGANPAAEFPARFEQLRGIEVPYPGALYLVGAGALGKIYCQWIRGRGGIALDVGSVLDGWADVPSRRYLAAQGVYGLDLYETLPPLTLRQSMERFNALCDRFGLDTRRLAVDEDGEGTAGVCGAD